VAPDNDAKGVLEAIGVQNATQAEGERHIVDRGVGLEVAKKPQSLLGVRQGAITGLRAPRDCIDPRGPSELLEELPLESNAVLKGQV
jgi:hypothetical protein